VITDDAVHSIVCRETLETATEDCRFALVAEPADRVFRIDVEHDTVTTELPSTDDAFHVLTKPSVGLWQVNKV
jgi:hypothetical protein